MSQIRQFELWDANDDTRLVCWLPDDRRIVCGSRLTLKGIPRRDWIVMKLYRTVKDDSELNRRWKVGGLK